MSDALPPPVPTRPGLNARYGDTPALNAIHAVVTGAGEMAPVPALPSPDGDLP